MYSRGGKKMKDKIILTLFLMILCATSVIAQHRVEHANMVYILYYTDQATGKFIECHNHKCKKR